MPISQDDQEELDEQAVGGLEIEAPADDEPEVEELPDGSAIVSLEGDAKEAADKTDFYANLAEDMDEGELKSIATELLEKIKLDKEARKKRDEQYEEGLRRTGLGKDAPGGAQFNGASKVVHPCLAEACVDFESAAIKEIFPPNGPVKTQILGKDTEKKQAKAYRKAQHMNLQLTKEIQSYRPELEQMLTQLPLGGSQYMKMFWNFKLKRPDVEFVPIDNIILPYSATNFYTSSRATHMMELDEVEYLNRINTGLWRDVDIIVASQEPDRTKAEKANDKIEGKDKTAYNEDGLRIDYEVYTTWEFEEDEYATKGEPAPYIITVDETTQTVLSIYRNWEENDELQQKLDWIVEYVFIPWRGAYGIGLPHLIGGLSGAATGALRALLDSAHINNAATLLKMKGARLSGQSDEVAVTQIQEIEGSAGVDDIRKLAMPMPFNPPSTVLFQLLGWLTDAAKGVVSTAEEKISEAGNNMPVGTAMALIEQGSKVFSAIHARLHASQEKTLAILHRLNRMYMDNEVRIDDELIVRKEDYEGDMDVIPVSDPQIWSETQRFAQINAVSQRAAAVPGLYDLRTVEKRILQMMKVPDFEELLAKSPEPKRMNPVNENVAMLMGSPALAFITQDHLSHIAVHIDFMQNPALGGNELAIPKFAPLCIEHLKQHIAMLYTVMMYEKASAAAGQELSDFMKMGDEVDQAVEQLLAAASPMINQEVLQTIQPIEDVIKKAVDLMRSMQMPPPVDPSQVQMQLGQAEIERKKAADQQKFELDKAKLNVDQQEAANKAQAEQVKLQQDIAEMQAKQQQFIEEMRLEREKIAADLEANMREMQIKLTTNMQDNQTAINISSMRVASGQGTGNLKDGDGIDPGRLMAAGGLVTEENVVEPPPSAVE